MLELKKNGIDFELHVKEVIAELTEAAKGRKITWEIGPLPVVDGDYAMLRLVMVNLITNALKFTLSRPNARIVIGAVSDHPDDLSGTMVLDMKYVDKLFGLFQASTAPKSSRGQVLGWSMSNASYIGTAAGSGRKARWTTAPHSGFHCQERGRVINNPK